MSLAIITNGYYDVESLYQWDTNQVLEITGLSLTTVPEIHFHNASMERAIVRQAKMDNKGKITVDIPNSLLQKDLKMWVYVCIYEGETFKTVSRIGVPVKSRPRPADYTIEDTDGEIYSFNALEKKVESALVEVDDKLSKELGNAINVVNDTLTDKIEYIDANYNPDNYLTMNSEIFKWRKLTLDGSCTNVELTEEDTAFFESAYLYEILMCTNTNYYDVILPQVYRNRSYTEMRFAYNERTAVMPDATPVLQSTNIFIYFTRNKPAKLTVKVSTVRFDTGAVSYDTESLYSAIYVRKVCPLPEEV